MKISLFFVIMKIFCDIFIVKAVFGFICIRVKFTVIIIIALICGKFMSFLIFSQM